MWALQPPSVRADVVRKENEANPIRAGRNVFLPFGQASPCDQMRALWTGFGQTLPPCDVSTTAPKIRECPYDDWMSTGCKIGQPLAVRVTVDLLATVIAWGLPSS